MITQDGSLDRYLAKRLDSKDIPEQHHVLDVSAFFASQWCQDKAVDFYTFIEEEFSPEPGVSLTQLSSECIMSSDFNLYIYIYICLDMYIYICMFIYIFIIIARHCIFTWYPFKSNFLIILRIYASESSFENSPGAHQLRPWMLPHRTDYGCRGTADVVHWFSLHLCSFSSFDFLWIFVGISMI